MKIPITMCHGTSSTLQAERFDRYFKIALGLGFSSISYDDLEKLFAKNEESPTPPIMFDFDHPVASIYNEIFPLMTDYGFKGNLFVNTKQMDGAGAEGEFMSWDEIGALRDSGWQIGAHTHTHPNLSELSESDPSGGAIRQEMETNDGILKKELGLTPKDFAFTGTTWSSVAEGEAKKRYRFGRLWIVGSMYQVDGEPIRYADLVGESGPDENDGGPPHSARYITKETDPYRIPSMELSRLIHDYDTYRRYLTGALEA